MKTYSCLLLTAVLFSAGCQTTPKNTNPAAAADVTVEFQNPDNFTDVRESFSNTPSQALLDDLSKHLKEAAARQLTAGEKLEVTFTDIDLAGDIIPGQRDDIRVVKSIYIPRMNLNFRLLSADGTVIKEGERRLTDMNFQNNISLTNRNDPLYYDKTLLDDWVRKEFNRS